MRFGCFVPQGWRLDLVGIDPANQWPTMVGVAHTIEASGFESAWVYDHFHTVPVATQEVTYEAWTLMSALAASTRTLRLGQMCTSVGYRNPAYLAKVAANVDVISQGRLELGIGAGWYDHEYAGYGYPFGRPAERIGQLDEGVELIRRLWTEDVVDHEGRWFHLDGAICRPSPLQQPHVPVWIAGGGEQLTLRVAARHADATNFGGSPEEFAHKVNVLAGHCADQGRELDDIVLSANFDVVIGETETEVADRLARHHEHLAAVVGDELATTMTDRITGGGTAGTPEQIVERLSAYAAEGLAYAIVYLPEAAYDPTVIETFGATVIDELGTPPPAA